MTPYHQMILLPYQAAVYVFNIIQTSLYTFALGIKNSSFQVVNALQPWFQKAIEILLC